MDDSAKREEKQDDITIQTKVKSVMINKCQETGEVPMACKEFVLHKTCRE